MKKKGQIQEITTQASTLRPKQILSHHCFDIEKSCLGMVSLIEGGATQDELKLIARQLMLIVERAQDLVRIVEKL